MNERIIPRDEMRDRLLRAVAAYANSLPKTSADAPLIYSHRVGLVNAMLGAMREPTEAMLRHALGHSAITEATAERTWRRMVDSALEE